MANRLKMAKIQAILALKEQGWSDRKIERELGVRRETVASYVRLASKPATEALTGNQAGEVSKPATEALAGVGVADCAGSADSKAATEALTGTETEEEAKSAKALTGSVVELARLLAEAEKPVPSRSLCAPYQELIEEKLYQGLSSQRIWQDLVLEHGFKAKAHSVRRYVRRLAEKEPGAFRRLETAPGDEAQVDFGTGAAIKLPSGKRRKAYVFRIVLSHSRKAYSEVVFRQTTENFIRCLENAFRYFGGVPKTLVIDNLKAAVTKADWYDPEIHPKVASFCEHYGTVILPTKPYTPRHKGKVEKGIDYVQSNALKGRTFASLDEQNRYLLWWEENVADVRIHGTTRKQVRWLFDHAERQALLSIPPDRFPYFQEERRTVHRDGHVEVEKAYYSAPPEYVGLRLWVRWDGHLVRIFDQRMRQITVHAKSPAGKFSTLDDHIAPNKRSAVEKGAALQLAKASRIGPYAGKWAEGVIRTRGVTGVRVLIGLTSLSKLYFCERIDAACKTADSYGSYRLRTVRELLKRESAPLQAQFEFMDQHPIIRDLSEYDQIVHDCFQRR